jgi:histidine triad (HIT) family protein
LGGVLLNGIFSDFSFILPVERLFETTSLLAIHHPSPSYPTHILIVPKRSYKSLLDLSLQDDVFMVDLFDAVQELVRRFDLEARGYRLVVNGGEAQDVAHLHFHLISEAQMES